MLFVGLILLYLAINKKFEPLLLVPIGFGTILSNIPEIGLAYSGLEKIIFENDPETLSNLAMLLGLDFINADVVKNLDLVSLSNAERYAAELGYTSGILYKFYSVSIGSGIAPLLIFMGVGAMTDFGPMLANPKTLILGAAAQFGIFATVIGALYLNNFEAFDFTLQQAAATGIIGGADGPTAIYVASILAPELLGAIAVAAYSYMALVPVIIPFIVKFTVTKREILINMKEQDEKFPSSNEIKNLSKIKIIFPIVMTIVVSLIVPSSTPLIGFLMFGNLIKEIGSTTNRLSKAASNNILNTSTIFLGLSIGATMTPDSFLNTQTIGIIVGGLFAFVISIIGGIMAVKIFNLTTKKKINPLIGATGLSAVPMASRVANEIAIKHDPKNHILHYAMASNISGVIGSAVAAGVLISFLG